MHKARTDGLKAALSVPVKIRYSQIELFKVRVSEIRIGTGEYLFLLILRRERPAKGQIWRVRAIQDAALCILSSPAGVHPAFHPP